MDAVLVNPAPDRLTSAEYLELQEKLLALEQQYAAAGFKMPVIKLPAPFTPAERNDIMALVEAALADSSGSVIAFLPATQTGERAVMRARELEHAPNRNQTYFTIHRTGFSRGGFKRNFGVSIRLASADEALKLKVNPGDLVMSGYDVQVDKPAKPELDTQ